MNEYLLKLMIDYAAENTSVYKDIDKLKFKDISILYKKNIIDNEYDYIADSYMTQFKNGKLIKKTTSGSTGNPMFCYWSVLDDTLSNMCTWRYRRKWYGVTPTDHLVQFFTTTYRGNRFIDENQNFIYNNNTLNINKMYINKSNIEEIMLKIRDFHPVWIITQPSVLRLIIDLISNDDIQYFSSVKYIEFSGEYLDSSTFNYIKEHLPNIIYGNLYGAIEVGTIAFRCPYGHLHLIINNAYVEILDKNTLGDTTEGSIVVTGLKNAAMPFIRYWLGDTVATEKNRCLCGCELPVLNIIAGREGQNIVNNNNNISSYFILHIVEKINSEYNNLITQHKLIQNYNNNFTALLSIKPGYHSWFNTISEIYINLLSELLGKDIKCEVILADNDKFELYKKHLFFESKIPIKENT